MCNAAAVLSSRNSESLTPGLTRMSGRQENLVQPGPGWPGVAKCLEIGWSGPRGDEECHRMCSTVRPHLRLSHLYRRTTAHWISNKFLSIALRQGLTFFWVQYHCWRVDFGIISSIVIRLKFTQSLILFFTVTVFGFCKKKKYYQTSM